MALTPEKDRAVCRVCGSQNIFMMPIGRYAGFFRLRVDTKKDPHLLFSRVPLLAIAEAPLWVRAIRKLVSRLAGRRDASQFRTSMTLCADCHGITPSHEYSFDDLVGLYRDYRSESYNRDRLSVEPGYAKIARHVGDHPSETKNRNAAVEAFLRRNASHFSGGRMIDYGGSDGRFLTGFMYEAFDKIEIFEPSDSPLHPTIDTAKVSKTATPAKDQYNFLACMHVVEHVGNPREFTMEAARYLVPGGILYIEVPHELTREAHGNFSRRIVDEAIEIHEHINKFDATSLPKLVASIEGLELLDSAEDTVDFGWVVGKIGRFLIRRLR